MPSQKGKASGFLGASAPADAKAECERRLERLRREADACTFCGRDPSSRLVFGEGDCGAELVLVGEAPGAEEEKQGRPFVGAAGRLLVRMLAGLGLKREQVYICNVLKCRPPNNRRPTPAEVAACKPFLVRQLALLRPKLILALGASAAQALLETTEPIGKLRGRTFEFHGVPLIPTLHPASILYQPANKEPVWEDLQRVAKTLNIRKVDPAPFFGEPG